MKNLLVLFLVVVLASCNPKCINKDAFLTGFDTFSEDVKTHYKKLEEKDWTNIDQEFKEYVEVCYPKFKEDLSAVEKVDFWKDVLSYGFYRGDNQGEYQLDIDLDLEQEMKELTDQGRVELEQFIRDEIQPDLENAIDNIVNEVESLGNQLKEWLDNL